MSMLKNRALGAYVGLVSAAVAAVTGIALLIAGNIVSDFNAVPPAILIVGMAISLAGIWKNVHFLAILPGAFYISAFALYLSSQLENISGRISGNGLGLTGTTLEMLSVFSVLMLIATVFSVAASFMNQGQKSS